MSGFNLDDYVTVAERVEQFYAKFPEGSLQAEVLELSDSRVVMRASAYRNPEDARPAIAHSMLTIPGKTPYTKDSEVENAETSAIGRAIALLGFEVKKSLASRNELEAKGATAALPYDGSLVGIARIGDRQTSDGQLRQTPDGHRLGFRLEPHKGDRGAILVEVDDPLATILAEHRDRWFNQSVTCWGRIEPRSFSPKGKAKPVTYQALVLAKIQTPAGTFPSDTAAPASESGSALDPDTGGTEPARVLPDSKDATTDTPATEGEPGQPPEADVAPEPPMSDGDGAPSEAAVAPGSAASGDQCDSASPYGDDERCELREGHKGPHKVLSKPFPETWTDR